MESEFHDQLSSRSALKFWHWLHVQMYENHCDIPQLKQLLQEGQDNFRGLLAVSRFLEETSDPTLSDSHQKCLNSIIQLYTELGIDIDELVETKSVYACLSCQFVRYTPLMQSIMGDKITIAKALIQLGADVNKTDSVGLTPLQWAVRYSNTELVALLIDQGANIHTEGVTPLLHVAMFHDRMDMMNLLIKRGANINMKHRPLDKANPCLCDYNCKCNPRSHMQDDSAIFTPMSALSLCIRKYKVDIDIIQLLFDRKDLVVDLDDLHWSLIRGLSDVALAILDKFTLASKLNLANDKIKGKYALHCLCERAFLFEDKSTDTKQLISIFIKYGWDINSVSDFPKDQWYRNTLLSLAVKQNNKDFVSFLLSLKADPSHPKIPIPSGELPLLRTKNLNLFGDLHFSVNWKISVLNATAFHAAIMYGNSETISVLFNNGANLELPFGSSTCDISLRFSPSPIKISVFNRTLTFFEILLTQTVVTWEMGWTRELQWFTDYLQSGKQSLDKIHLTLSILGGNIFVISQILRFLPENVSLEKYTLFENEIPAILILMSLIDWPTSGNLEDKNYSSFWKCLTEIIHQFVQRGYSLNDFKTFRFAYLPIGYRNPSGIDKSISSLARLFV